MGEGGWVGVWGDGSEGLGRSGRGTRWVGGKGLGGLWAAAIKEGGQTRVRANGGEGREKRWG